MKCPNWFFNFIICLRRINLLYKITKLSFCNKPVFYFIHCLCCLVNIFIFLHLGQLSVPLLVKSLLQVGIASQFIELVQQCSIDCVPRFSLSIFALWLKKNVLIIKIFIYKSYISFIFIQFFILFLLLFGKEFYY